MPLIARSLAKAGIHVDVATTDDNGPGACLSVPLEESIPQNGWYAFYFRKQTEFYKVSLPFRRWVKQHAPDYDLVHIHALFSFTSSCAARAARRTAVPYVIRPLGVLNRWGMANRRRWLKRLSFRYIEQPILQNATAMHYTSYAEQVEAEQSGATAPALVVPLGIEVGEYQRLARVRKSSSNSFLKRPDVKSCCFFRASMPRRVSICCYRRSPKYMSSFHESVLVIAGSGEESYVSRLRAQALATRPCRGNRLDWISRGDRQTLGVCCGYRLYAAVVLRKFRNSAGRSARCRTAVRNDRGCGCFAKMYASTTRAWWFPAMHRPLRWLCSGF